MKPAAEASRGVSVVFRPSSHRPEPARDVPPISEAAWREEEFRDWPPLQWTETPIRPPEPSRGSVWLVRGLVAIGVVALGVFFVWLCDPEKRGDPWLFWPLFAAFAYRALFWVVEWLNYARPKFEQHVEPKRKWTVDVLTTACPGEPRGMILRTLLAMKAIRYPHTDWLCDEGDDPVLRKACEELGIRHVTRKIKKDAKAGNINNALTHATGEIAVVLDPDHEPSPYLLDRVLGHFEDPKVGFVQSVQAYRNQSDGFVADGAAKQTYLFYGPLMIGMNAYGTTQAIGANCVFRRAALDSIGGHAAGLSEDMHTTMRLYAKGWRSVYVPEVLTRGLVPSTLSAYCKQQLKWACGSIELLLQEYPKLWRGMTFWQRLHYFVGPLYFLRGFFQAIHILVPIICLIFGGIVLRINLLEYLAMYLPVLIIAGVVRQRTQHWAIEKKERGAHLIGGILGAGCWWVFLRGALCAFARIKLPYIPTPKENEAHDSWGLAAPNLIAAAVSVGAVGYGLNHDWTPYNLMMAAFALLNAAQLLFVAAIGQQRTLQRLAYAFAHRDWVNTLVYPLAQARFHVHTTILTLMRERPAFVSVAILAISLVIYFRPHKSPSASDAPQFKDTGGFYVGARFESSPTAAFPADFERVEQSLGSDLRLFPMNLLWASLAKTPPVPEDLLRSARLHGAVPLITWEPTTAGTARADRQILGAVLNGTFDDYINDLAAKLRDFGDPVLICFAPDPDNPASPWSPQNGTPAQEYIEAWDYIVALFNNAGASNVGWVWQPATPNAFSTHLPSAANIDWIGLSLLNRGRMGGGRWREFGEMYDQFRPRIENTRLPVLLTGFGSTNAGGDRRNWMRRALTQIAADFPEIRGLVLPPLNDGWYADSSPETAKLLATSLAQPELHGAKPAIATSPPGLWGEQPRQTVRSPAIHGSAGNYELTVDGAPFYIRGVAYNPGHDWRDGYVPLTRRELDADFERLNAAGANTVRRYGSNWYDRNVLHVAADHGIKVLYGFWFDQGIDYRTNSLKLDEYAAKVEETVRAHRDEPAIIAWSLGNEVWGLLKHHYSQPYLTEVRHAHVDFVERLARRVHELDPQRPVFTAHEHSPQLAGNLMDFSRGAPSLDFTGINSYYESRISRLRGMATYFDPTRPYLVSEFGPDGYWESKPAQRTPFGALLEPSSIDKVRSYERAWTVHTEGNRGANLGGIAYCWRDRYEATATWFGLTDTNGRPKPACLALERLWTGRQAPPAPRVVELNGPTGQVLPGASIEAVASVDAPSGERLDYKWRLADEDFDFKVGRIEPAKDGLSARISLPRKPGVYRVYFSASNGKTVDESNFPVEVSAESAAASGDVPLDWTTIQMYRRVVGP